MQNDIKKAIDILRKGGVILYPTDTIWGLGCDATNAAAVKKVYDIKQRLDSKSMLVLVDDIALVSDYVSQFPDIARDLVELSDKPLTIIYSGAKGLASNLIAEDGSVGIRVTSDEFCKQLIVRFGKAIVSTSANISGEPSPAIFDEISKEIIDSADYVVNWRQTDTAKSKPSGIIKLGAKGEIKVIRE